MTQQVLQLCHDYRGPFVTVCRQYIEAQPDAEVTTVFIQGVQDECVERDVGGRVLFMEQSGENLRGIKFAQIFRLFRLLKNQQIDVVIAHRYKAIYLAGILSYFRPLPILLGVAHEHNVFRRVTRKLFVTFWRRKFLIAGVSKSVVADIARFCPSLVTEDRLYQLPNVLPAGFKSELQEKHAARIKLRLDPNALIVGTTGRLVKKKSIETLLEGFEKLQSPEAQLVLIGDGPLSQELKDQAADLGLTDRIHFLGHVPDAGYLVRLFDVFVLPSGQAEAFGLVLLEAMVAKVPVLTSTAAGPAEVVGNAEWQFKQGSSDSLAEKITALIELDSDEKQAMLDENANRVAQVYSREKFRSTLDAILNISD